LIPEAAAVAFASLAACFDWRRGRIPPYLWKACLAFGIGYHLFLSAFAPSVLLRLVVPVIVFPALYLLWLRGLLGGGDVKFLTALSAVVPHRMFAILLTLALLLAILLALRARRVKLMLLLLPCVLLGVIV